MKDLTPGAKYIYALYMMSHDEDFYHEALVSVNNGAKGRTWVNDDKNARFSGVAVATGSGQIKFRFEGVDKRVHLCRIAIARVGAAAIPKPASPPSRGMVAWFKSEHAGSIWPSSVGSFEGKADGYVHRTIEAGNGADRAVTTLKAGTSGSFSFGKVLPRTHSVCSVTRYSGKKQFRILQVAEPHNWLHGHHKGYSGVAEYNKVWLTDSSRHKNVRDWVVLCATNTRQRAYDSLSNSPKNVAKRAGAQLDGGPHEITINKGNRDKGDWQVMELITWNRALSETELRDSVEYLKWKLRTGAVLEVSEHLSTFHQNNFKAFADPGKDHVESQTFRPSLANGYRADLVGWTHTRGYASGFLRTAAGSAAVL